MTEYLRVADTAKYIRKKLKEAYPKLKFTVRSSSYSGGASIQVGYPREAETTHEGLRSELNNMLSQYQAAGFDGMIDYKYYKTCWLTPEGEIVRKDNGGGTLNSGGTVPPYEYPAPCEGCIEINTGADYIYAQPNY